MLHPSAATATGSATKVAFGVPFPRGFVADVANIRVTNAAGTEIPAAVSQILPWRSIGGSDPASVRAALVYVDYTFANRDAVTLNVSWGTARTQNLTGSQPAPDTLWIPIASSGTNAAEYPSGDAIREPSVYVTLPADWMSKSLLRSRSQPSGTNSTLAWFDANTVNFGRTAVNDVASTVPSSAFINYTGGEEPWLFDRAMALYNVYLRTGDVKWLRHAHRASQWYAGKVNSIGIFSLASYAHDLKYSYGVSLLTDYLLTGDARLAAPIQRVAAAGVAEWQTTYSTSIGFWTERHHTYALLAAVTAYELTGAAEHATRATALADLTISMSNNAAKCPLHTVEQHEGVAGDTRMMCSPWMSALLADAMMRYYVVSKDADVITWLAGMGDYVQNYALYDGGIEASELGGLKMPWYMVGPTGRVEDGRGWGDVEHACDVAGLVAKAVWAKGVLGQSKTALQTTANDLLTTCKWSHDYWHRSAATLPEWRLAPARKFNWWFGTTLDLGWMLAN